MKTKLIEYSSFTEKKPLFGIIGGMGPLSSAQFIHSIYRYCLNRFTVEQDYPRVIMISDPLIPDRAKAFKEQKMHAVISFFEKNTQDLMMMGANEILIACITAHLYIDKLNVNLKKSITDIVKLLYDELDKINTRSLILSSRATYENRIIDHTCAHYPSMSEIQLIQTYVCKIKVSYSYHVFSDFISYINTLILKYHVDYVILACTELHLIRVFLEKHSLKLACRMIDPLEISANYIIQKSLVKE